MTTMLGLGQGVIKMCTRCSCTRRRKINTMDTLFLVYFIVF